MNGYTARQKRRAGFTIIELMIVIAIIPIVTAAVVIPMIEYPRLYAAMEADREMAEQARVALQWMGRDVRQAPFVLHAAGPYRTTGETLVLAMPEGAGAAVVVWSTDQGALTRTEFAGKNARHLSERMILASPKTSLIIKMSPRPPETSRVTVTINSSRMIMDREREFSLSGEFSLRRTKP